MRWPGLTAFAMAVSVLPAAGPQPSAAAGGFPQWAYLTTGPFAVGFDVLAYRDLARAYAGDRTLAGAPIGNDPPARPVPVSLWYPAEPAAGCAPMRFRDYVHQRAAEDDLAPLTDDRRRQAETWFARYSGARGVTPAEMERVLDLEARAVWRAAPRPGRYPLVLYAPGYSQGSHENTVLAEYLASHGFIVAMTPMRGLLARDEADDMTGVGAQVEDLGYILARLQERSSVDASRLAVAGFDEGGLAALLFAFRHRGVDAVITLDGYVGYRDAEAAARFPHYDGSRLEATYLELRAGVRKRDRDPSRHSPALFEAIRQAPAYAIRFARLAHDDFTSDHLVNYVHTGRDEPTFAAGDIDRSYAAMCRYALWFLQAFLQADLESRDRLHQPPEAAGMPPGWVTIARK